MGQNNLSLKRFCLPKFSCKVAGRMHLYSTHVDDDRSDINVMHKVLSSDSDFIPKLLSMFLNFFRLHTRNSLLVVFPD